VKRVSVQQVFGAVFRERRVAAALVHLASREAVSACWSGDVFAFAGVYEGRLHSGALTGHSDPNRLRYVPPLMGAEVLNRLAEFRGEGGLNE
jgi:hypothetical protein